MNPATPNGARRTSRIPGGGVALRILAAVATIAATARAAVVETASPSLGWTLPDDTASGVLHTLTLTEPGIVSSVSVRLRLSVPDGGTAWLGDLYVHLEHASGLSVLMNRVGRSGTLPFGYADRGAVDVVFSDAAPLGDIHGFHAALAVPEPATLDGPLTGTWQPDGRTADPSAVLAASTRTATLGTFTGHAVAGDWNLFLADLSGGGHHRLEAWSLSFEVGATPVPEPASATALAAGLLAAGLLARRLPRSGRKPSAIADSNTSPSE